MTIVNNNNIFLPIPVTKWKKKSLDFNELFKCNVFSLIQSITQ